MNKILPGDWIVYHKWLGLLYINESAVFKDQIFGWITQEVKKVLSDHWVNTIE